MSLRLHEACVLMRRRANKNIATRYILWHIRRQKVPRETEAGEGDWVHGLGQWGWVGGSDAETEVRETKIADGLESRINDTLTESWRG